MSERNAEKLSPEEANRISNLALLTYVVPAIFIVIWIVIQFAI